jgi:hypothetical protein
LAFVVIVGTTASEMSKHYLEHKQQTDTGSVAELKIQNQALTERVPE